MFVGQTDRLFPVIPAAFVRGPPASEPPHEGDRDDGKQFGLLRFDFRHQHEIKFKYDEATMIPLPTQATLIRDHRAWLGEFDDRNLKLWNDSLESDPQAALCEACVRWLMAAHNHRVEPNVDLDGKGERGAEKRPDFKCVNLLGEFYVEATVIPIETADRITGLEHKERFTCKYYGLLTEQVFDKAWDKSRQCAAMKAPTLLAVGTFHEGGSIHGFNRQCANELLTGRGSIRWNVDMRTGAAVGDAWHGTDLEFASFLKPADCRILHARPSISGILLCGFGYPVPLISGILHPNAQYPFRPEMLPGIVFGEVKVDFEKGELVSDWPDEPRAKQELTDLPEWPE